MINQMKVSVLVLTSVYPRSQEDTEVPWLRASLRKLAEGGCGVSVVAPSHKGLKSHAVDGVRVYRYRYAPAALEILTHDEGAPSKIAKNPFLQLLAVPYVISGSLKTLFLCFKLKPKIIHVHWPFPHAFMAFFTKIFYRFPIVLNFHGAELLLMRKKKWIKPFLKFFIKRADAVFANSSFTAKRITEVYPREIEISPYGTTFGSRRECAARVGNGKYNALFVGRHIERKGIGYLIKAAALLDADKYQVRIVGRGDQTEKLKAQAAREAPGQVVFLGKLSNEDLEKEYRSAGCFVLPAIVDSRGDTEGLGVVMIEAAEYGVPIVASGVGGIVDVIIDNKTGLLVKEKSPEELAAAICRLCGNPDLSAELAKNCRERVGKFFSWERITAKQIELYQHLIGSRR
ncbi:MAG: glycosyltransferase family 4 protein [Chitinispirillales bacterium]|jgi:glycosyltransferase involved in cell wall biosynthesis|nr:glycosyltransferase family 4 protein [Chitinispirillales bacterium]